MTDKRSLLRIGVADFAEPTLLLVGDSKSFSWLADQIDARQELKLAEMPEFIRMTISSMDIVPAINSGRLTRTGSSSFILEVSDTEATQFAEQLRALAVCSTPAHVYLDPQINAAGVQLLASKGEYDPEKIFSEC